MIPKNIKQKHIFSAIEEIEKNGTPKNREATKYQLLHKGKTYPPKYVISLANHFINGSLLGPSDFGGGIEVNNFLCQLGFEVTAIKPTIQAPSKAQHFIKLQLNHNQRCDKCKNRIMDMLRQIYGKIEIDHKIEASTVLDTYLNAPEYKFLQKIFSDLEKLRNNKNFVKQKRLHRCDVYIPSINSIVEFDESQHFTSARKLTLESYPSTLNLGFKAKQWKDLCDRINAKDTSPIYRDEQRAWYDTIRDFLPLTKDMGPTIRIHMGDYDWCSLDVNNPEDVEAFREKIGINLIEKVANPRVVDEATHVATVNIQSKEEYNENNRIVLLGILLGKLKGVANAVIFPAGLFRVTGNKNASSAVSKYAGCVIKILRELDSDTVACFGIDGRGSKDQLAIAVTKNEIIGVGRKFHPTNYERERISFAKNYTHGDSGYSRIIDIKGRKAFLAVCYDGFGISQNKLKNPGVDLVFNLVHGFYPRGEGGSGDVDFARKGFAGASKQWGCPVFGAAVFFDRPIPGKWPTGVSWKSGDISTRAWRYSYNTVSPKAEFVVQNNNGVSNEIASVRVFDI